MTVENLRTVQAGNLKAFFDVRTAEGILIKGFKLVDGKNGLFVGMPADPDKNEKQKFWDKVIMSKDQASELLKAAKKEYGA